MTVCAPQGLPYVHTGFSMVLYSNSLFAIESSNFLPRIQYMRWKINRSFFVLVKMCVFMLVYGRGGCPGIWLLCLGECVSCLIGQQDNLPMAEWRWCARIWFHWLVCATVLTTVQTDSGDIKGVWWQWLDWGVMLGSSYHWRMLLWVSVQFLVCPLWRWNKEWGQRCYLAVPQSGCHRV
jgi:hypothetical protein